MTMKNPRSRARSPPAVMAAQQAQDYQEGSLN